MSSATLASYAILAVCLLAASWYDTRHRRIPNWLVLTGAAGALPIVVATALDQGLWPGASHLVAGLALLAFGMICFALRWFGGGDAKLLGAIGLYFAIGEVPLLLVLMSVSAVVLLAIWATYRLMRGLKIRRSGTDPYSSLPFGIAICLGTVLTIGLTRF